MQSDATNDDKSDIWAPAVNKHSKLNCVSINEMASCEEWIPPFLVDSPPLRFSTLKFLQRKEERQNLRQKHIQTLLKLLEILLGVSSNPCRPPCEKKQSWFQNVPEIQTDPHYFPVHYYCSRPRKILNWYRNKSRNTSNSIFYMFYSVHYYPPSTKAIGYGTSTVWKWRHHVYVF